MTPQIVLKHDSTLKCWKAELAQSINKKYKLPPFEIGETRHEALGKLLEMYADGLGVEIWTK